MDDIGAELRGKREGLLLTQAEVAHAVGTTQQTVARIERGETSHSRYVGRIRAFLDGRIGGAQAPLSPSLVPTWTLAADGKPLSLAQGVLTQLHFPDPSGQVYAVHLQFVVRGPLGDAIFRPGDVLVVDPTAVARHFDWCLHRTGDETCHLMLVADPSEVPPQMSETQLREWGYGVVPQDDAHHFHKVVARYVA